jgi:hypothetical protein
MSPEIDVYVSRSHKDDEFVTPFLHELHSYVEAWTGREEEVTFWRDDNNITVGENWREAIRNAVARAKAMLALVSPRYLASESAIQEFNNFKLSGRPIFPVVLEEFAPNKDMVRQLLGDQPGYALPSLRRKKERYEIIQHLARDIRDVLAGFAPQPSAQTPPQISQGPVSKGYVFLSYAEEDEDFLAKLRAFFGERGYAYWEFKTSDRDYQKRIDLELEDVISRAVATVSVLSEAWKTSTWSFRELYFSQEIGKPVFLVKAKPFSPILAIAGLPYIDFTNNSQQAFSLLAKELTRRGL